MAENAIGTQPVTNISWAAGRLSLAAAGECSKLGKER
jgi:hypothetical protein